MKKYEKPFLEVSSICLDNIILASIAPDWANDVDDTVNVHDIM